MHHSHRRAISAAAALVLLGVFSAAGAKASAPEIKPKHAHTMRGQARTRPSSGNGITAHGGRVVNNLRVVEIFYGSWDRPGVVNPVSTHSSVVQLFDTNFGVSGNYKINSTYKFNNITPSAVTVVGTVVDSYSHGTSLSDAGVKAVVDQAAAAAPAAWSTMDTLWFVMGSKDVNLTSGYGTQYCGWHTHGTVRGMDQAWAATIDANRALNACAQQTQASPNGNPGVDGMLSVVAHEIEETASDIDLNAWYDTRGYENADKCAWTFGTTYAAPGGGVANMKVGGKDFLIQRNWVNASGGYCAVSIP